MQGGGFPCEINVCMLRQLKLAEGLVTFSVSFEALHCLPLTVGVSREF